MAIGDDAAAAGFPLVPESGEDGKVKYGAREINRTRDLIAQRTSTVVPVAKGGTGASTAETARANLGLSPQQAVFNEGAGNRIRLSWGEGRVSYHVDSTVEEQIAKVSDLSSISATAAAASSTASSANTKADQAKNGDLNSAVYARTLSGSWRSLYVASDGTIGWVSSSRSVKEDIASAPIDVQAVLAMEVVTYHRVDEAAGAVEHGLIAEDLHELGLTWLVDYGTGESPEGVRYDLLALALIPVVRSLDERITALEAGR